MKSEFFLESGTLRMCFIKSSLDRVQVEMGDIINGTLTKDWKQEPYNLQNTKLANFFTLTNYEKKVKCLFWQPQPNVVVFLNNMPDGWPTLINLYNKKYSKEIIKIALSGSKDKFPIYMYEHLKDDNQRIVYVLKETDKWIFFQKGNLLPFENSLLYKKRKITDRLNNEIIKQYLIDNGIDIDNPNFWKSDSAGIFFWTILNSQ